MAAEKRILVVDDSQFLVSILSSTLKGAGYGVTVAGDVREAVLSLKTKGVPDLLIMDLNLPDMQGDAACQAIRKAPACAKLPIILISGMSDQKLQEAVQRAGANGYLKKPFSPSSILRWIRDHADLLEIMAEQRAAGVPTSGGSAAPPPAASAPPPAAASAPPPPAAASVPPPPPPPPPPEEELDYEGELVAGGVMVIEDSSFLRSVLQDTLAQAGYAVCLASTMATGTALLKREKPGLILLDVNLPDMKGDEACAILKSIEDCKGIAVILMTSAPEEVLRAKAEAASADGYLRKPFTPANVLEWMKQQTWVKPKGAKASSHMPTGGLAGAPADSPPPPPPPPGASPDLAAVLQGQLGSKDAGLRAQAAYSIGEQKLADLAPRLRAMLRDPEPAVVSDVLWALGEMKDAAAVREVRMFLEKAEGAGDDLNVRLRAIEALGKMGNPEAIKSITLCIGSDRPRDERVVAIQALADLGDASVREDLQRLMFEDESDLQDLARDALEKIADRG